MPAANNEASQSTWVSLFTKPTMLVVAWKKRKATKREINTDLKAPMEKIWTKVGCMAL
jgi:hypothetical protein